MTHDLINQFGRAPGLAGDGFNDPGLPVFATMVPEAQRRLHGLHGRAAAGPVAFVHHEDIGNLHQARLGSLDMVARLGHQHHHGRVDQVAHVQFGLAHARALYEYIIEAGRVKYVSHVGGVCAQAASRPAGGHAADEHALVIVQVRHAHPVAEQRAGSERTGRVNRHDRNAMAGLAQDPGDHSGQGGFAGARWPGQAHPVGMACSRVNVVQQPARRIAPGFHHRNGPGNTWSVPVEQPGDKPVVYVHVGSPARFSRNTRFRIFPLGFFGNSSRKKTFLGFL